MGVNIQILKMYISLSLTYYKTVGKVGLLVSASFPPPWILFIFRRGSSSFILFSSLKDISFRNPLDFSTQFVQISVGLIPTSTASFHVFSTHLQYSLSPWFSWSFHCQYVYRWFLWFTHKTFQSSLIWNLLFLLFLLH